MYTHTMISLRKVDEPINPTATIATTCKFSITCLTPIWYKYTRVMMVDSSVDSDGVFVSRLLLEAGGTSSGLSGVA